MARPAKILNFALCSALLVPAVQLVGGSQPLQAAQVGNRSLFALAATSGSNGVVGLAAPVGLGNGYLAPLEQLRGVRRRCGWYKPRIDGCSGGIGRLFSLGPTAV